MEFFTGVQQEEYERLCSAGKKAFLKELIASEPDEESHVGLAKMLFSLEDEDAKYSAMDSRSKHDPKLFDVLINDISEIDLQNIGTELSAPRLSVAAKFESNTDPINGIMYGPTLRVFLPLIVSKRRKNITVLFLFNTGSPNTYLREDTLRALGFLENIPSDTNVIINGTGVTVYQSRGHFENVDLIGQDWMAFSRAKVLLDYGLKTAEVRM